MQQHHHHHQVNTVVTTGQVVGPSGTTEAMTAMTTMMGRLKTSSTTRSNTGSYHHCAGEKRFLRQRPPLPKRVSLPENLEFQPLKLLTMKQSMNVEKQLVDRKTPVDELLSATAAAFGGGPNGSGDCSTVVLTPMVPAATCDTEVVRAFFMPFMAAQFTFLCCLFRNHHHSILEYPSCRPRLRCAAKRL